MFARFLTPAAVAALLLGAGVNFHTHLVRAEPAVDTTVTSAPKQVQLWFNERPELALSGATLMKEDHSPVAVIKMLATEDSLSVAGQVPVTLAPARYMVMWKTGSRDGHVVRGTYYFTFDPASKAAP